MYLSSWSVQLCCDDGFDQFKKSINHLVMSVKMMTVENKQINVWTLSNVWLFFVDGSMTYKDFQQANFKYTKNEYLL